MRAVIVSVDFGDFLQLTLPYNRHHWDEVLIISYPGDELTIEVARENNASIYLTESFYRNGAKFNKFLSLEEGLDFFGRREVLAFVDADIFWPKTLPLKTFERGYLYSFQRRRLLLDVTAEIPSECSWESLPLDPQYSECMGFTQIFHATDNALGSPPWHKTDIPHAALGDSYFQNKWDLSRKIWMDGCVLHLGDYARNWCGRVTQYRSGVWPISKEQRDSENTNLMKRLWPERLEE